MAGLTIHNARILTLAGEDTPRRRETMRDLGVIEHGFVEIDGDRISSVGAGNPPVSTSGHSIDAAGRVLMPAFVDCHTHACWAGDRFDEFEMKLAGTSYLDILKSGGGIMSTVRAVREATQDELVECVRVHLERMTALGTGTVEIKSGYGLNLETELKMLRAVREAASGCIQTVTSTFLGAHALDMENDRFVEHIIEEALPACVNEFPGIVCDAYCEQGAWTLDQTRHLFEKAIDLSCPIRVHTDQFNSLGMTRWAIEHSAISVDHLEAIEPADIELLAASDTIAVALPCSGFHLDDRYAPGRKLIDAGCALAIATNYNPGSSPTPSMPFAIALACRKLHLTAAEAITCATINAACVLRLAHEVGSIQPGKRADLQLLDFQDERELGFEFATAGPQVMILSGNIIRST